MNRYVTPMMMMDSLYLKLIIKGVTVIRVIFDGKAFIPKQSISLPDRTEATVFLDQADSSGQSSLNDAVRAYYQQDKEDADDAAWDRAVAPQSSRAWSED